MTLQVPKTESERTLIGQTQKRLENVLTGVSVANTLIGFGATYVGSDNPDGILSAIGVGVIIGNYSIFGLYHIFRDHIFREGTQ